MYHTFIVIAERRCSVARRRQLPNANRDALGASTEAAQLGSLVIDSILNRPNLCASWNIAVRYTSRQQNVLVWVGYLADGRTQGRAVWAAQLDAVATTRFAVSP